MRIMRVASLLFAFGAGTGAADEDGLRLGVPAVLESSGFAQYLVPRYSLKTGVRIDRVAEGAGAEMAFEPGDPHLFSGLGASWTLTHDGDPRAVAFEDWLRSDVGKRTIESFEAPDGSVFSVRVKQAVAAAVARYDGDAAAGESISLTHCGRCHVVNETNRMNGMGSTPSFAVLRGFRDWDQRFAQFFLLNPHPSFTLIEEISEPFDPSRPPPIVPLRITLEDLDAILAYVEGIAPADLGAPLQFQ